MRKMIRATIWMISTFLFSSYLTWGFEVYTRSGQSYSAAQYKIFDSRMVISLKDGRQQNLPVSDIDWKRTPGDKNVFQFVETNLVYLKDGKAIRSKGYMIRNEEKVEVITQDNKILEYKRSDIDFGKIANYLMKRKIKLSQLEGQEHIADMESNSLVMPFVEEEFDCGDSIVISSNGNPLIKFRFEATTLKDAKFNNLFLNFVIIKASAKNLSDTSRRLSYNDFTLITNEGTEVKPDGSIDNTFFIEQLDKNAMTFGTIRFSFTAASPTGTAEYLVYRGAYGRFKCRLQGNSP